MTLEEAYQKLRRWYYPTWEVSLSTKELVEKLEDIQKVRTGSAKYWKLKSQILRSVGRNGIEELSRGKDEQGMLTQKIFDELDNYFLTREIDKGLLE